MNAEAIRVRLADEDLDDLQALLASRSDIRPRLRRMIGHVAEGYGPAWRAVVSSAPEISDLSEKILSSALARTEATHRLHGEDFADFSEAFSGPVFSSARALAALEGGFAASDPHVAGRLVVVPERISTRRLSDGTLVASALAVAIAECLDAHSHERCEVLLRLEPLLESGADTVKDAWSRTLSRHLPRMARHARLAGHGLAASNAKALIEWVMRTGKALQGSRPSETVFACGAAALEQFAPKESAPPRLPETVACGAAALATAYGFPVSWRWSGAVTAAVEPEAPLEEFDRFDPSHAFTFVAYGMFPLRFSWKELSPLAMLTVSTASERLEKRALSPKCPEWASRRYAMLASAVRESVADHPEETSFARALGIREVMPETAHLLDGTRLYRAAPVGRHAATSIVMGRGGREMRLHAVADEYGRLVGYVGLDPLSEEFHGMPERYVYDLEGWRRGRLVDGIFRKGQPRRRMMTAPEGVELSGSRFNEASIPDPASRNPAGISGIHPKEKKPA